MPGLVVGVESGLDDTVEERVMYSSTVGLLAVVDKEESRAVDSGGRERMLKFRKSFESHSAIQFLLATGTPTTILRT